MRLLESTTDVIAELGGLRAVAELFGVTYKAAHNWKASGKFPARTYDVIDARLRERECHAPRSLWGWSDAVAECAGCTS